MSETCTHSFTFYVSCRANVEVACLCALLRHFFFFYNCERKTQRERQTQVTLGGGGSLNVIFTMSKARTQQPGEYTGAARPSLAQQLRVCVEGRASERRGQMPHQPPHSPHPRGTF